MQKLLAFIIAKRHWFLFFLCEIVSFALIYRNNVYQQNIMLSSTNAITGRLLSVSGTVFSFFDLQKINHELLERNGLLEIEIIRLREQLDMKVTDTTKFDKVFLNDTVLRNYKYQHITANVVNSSVRYPNNYITINKGASDGIRPEMGVVSPQGIVGIVTNVNNSFSSIMSILHLKSRTSCKIRHTNFSGSLSWKGDDVLFAYLDQIATHATFQVGDTIETSGYSDVFPPGILVGTIASYNKQTDDNFYTLKVRLATDFQSLNVLRVIDNPLQKDQKEIEQEARKND